MTCTLPTSITSAKYRLKSHVPRRQHSLCVPIPFCKRPGLSQHKATLWEEGTLIETDIRHRSHSLKERKKRSEGSCRTCCFLHTQRSGAWNLCRWRGKVPQLFYPNMVWIQTQDPCNQVSFPSCSCRHPAMVYIISAPRSLAQGTAHFLPSLLVLLLARTVM